MLRIGITGGIGCGKSEVCRRLEQQGIPIIQADLVAKALMDNNKKIKSRAKQEFGNEVYLPSGKLNRKRLAESYRCRPFRPGPV